MGNVEAAVQQLSKHKMDLILSDINLGNDAPDGYELLRYVR